VPVAVAGDVHQADFRLAVLVVAEDDGHDSLLPWISYYRKELSLCG
jgi:hypothetical protein